VNNIQIRRRILQLLYEVHNRDPHGAIEQDKLPQQLNLPTNRVQPNLAYLCEKKLVQLRRTTAGGCRVYHFAKITASGIDLLDDPSEFNARFPPQVIYQYVAGDSLQVTIGDNASEVTVGKDIIKLQFGADHSFEEVSTRFIASFESRSGLSKVDRLQALLQSEELDLGKIQRIKRSLIEQEGRPAAMTTALFSHPAVIRPIREAVERLIGRS
jgi:hypothetical protein